MEERLRFDQDQGRGGHGWFRACSSCVPACASNWRHWSAPHRRSLRSRARRRTVATSSLSGLGARTGRRSRDDRLRASWPAPAAARIGCAGRVAEVAARPTAAALPTILSCITPRTKLLALSHVLWTTGQVMPVHELKHESGLPVLVDGAQSVGAIPVDVGELDYYTVSGQKWLCGPEPVGALYVRDPEALGSRSRRSFAQTSIEPDGSFVTDRRRGAVRFGLAAAAVLAGLEAALERRARLAFRARAARWRRLSRRTARAVRGDRRRRAEHARVVRPAGRCRSETAARLYEQESSSATCPGRAWVRASCGWWTSGDDIDRLVSALAWLSGRGAYRSSTVPSGSFDLRVALAPERVPRLLVRGPPAAESSR